MGRFLREYWLWIVLPVLLVGLALTALLWLGDDAAGGGYPIF